MPGAALSTFRALNGATRLSFLTEAALAGSAEALSAVAYANSEFPQSLASEERTALSIEAEKNGIIWGSAFALLPR